MSKQQQLWDKLKVLKSDNYKWVDLTHELSSKTPHWYGFDELGQNKLFDYENKNSEDQTWDEAPMRVFQYTIPGQYGTHVDIPAHFDKNGRTQEEIRIDELVYPLVVINKSETVQANPDYALSVQDILDWEKVHGQIPEGAFVAFRTDWHKRSAENFDNNDEKGIPHYPGWDVSAIEFLVKQRNIGAIGHETSDTDPGFITSNPEGYPYPAEKYILDQDRIQIELLANLDQVPAVGAVIFTTFPKLKGGVGFPARVFAVAPTEA